ncbi:hypothetical protein OAS39_08355 [Pirellulales bacterium]|nr:hypothetical protein [Pirellulales bacterium]
MSPIPVNLDLVIPRARLPARRRSVYALGVAVLVGVLAASPAVRAGAEWQSDIGYDTLQSFLGTQVPSGVGVSISMVEASNGDPATGAYFPVPTDFDPDAAQDPPTNHDQWFGNDTDPDGIGVTFIDGSLLQSNGLSNHSAGQARVIISNLDGQSIAPRVNEITVYEANHYLEDVLNIVATAAPLAQNFRVQNHSWIGSYGDRVDEEHPKNVKALRRFDYAIDSANGGKGMTTVVGVNNAASMPYLLSHAYNSIAVGNSDGSHSVGLTLDDDPAIAGDNSYGPGRLKPDIVSSPPVAANSTTSTSTSAVSSVAVLLHETATAIDAARAEVIKAQLLAGATKDEPEFTSWSRTSTQPLDIHYGAGEVNLLNSYKIQRGGRHSATLGPPVELAGTYGWDYGEISEREALNYNFVIESGTHVTEASIILTWFAEVTDFDIGAPDVANLDLRLFESTSAFKDLEIDRSVSEVDNVEHLYLTDLGPGIYTLEVSADAVSTRDFGIAWRWDTLFDETSADFNLDGTVDGNDWLTAQRNYRTIVGASHADGDADGDGDVDSDDLELVSTSYGVTRIDPPLPGVALSAVPEPGAVLLLLLGVVLLRSGRRRVYAA